MPREHTGHSKHTLPTTQLYTWTSPDGQYRNQIDYILAAKDGEALYSQQKLDWELIVAQIMHSFTAKFRLKLKKVGKSTGPFRYDLNQIPYDYTVEVRNRFKVLDLIDRVPDELWMEVRDIVQGIKTILMEKKCKKAKWLSGKGLTNSCEKRSKKQRSKGKL